jgi:endonuclease/exonuclease/phosphatase family metal-dependent hydrolase
VIQEYAKADPAIILCGDFNSFPHSSSVSLIYNTQEYAKNKFYRDYP